MTAKHSVRFGYCAGCVYGACVSLVATSSMTERTVYRRAREVEMTFVVGQRVRVCQYISWPNCGDPHFIVGHFGHIESIDRDYYDVRICLGPDGGKPDERMYRDKNGRWWPARLNPSTS